MGDLIKLVKRFQKSRDPKVADDLVVSISPALRLSISLRAPIGMVDDILQETLLGIILGLLGFDGKTERQFLAYCHRIAKNKVVDALRRLGRDRERICPDEQSWEGLAETKPALSKHEREEFDEVKELLRAVRPPCWDYLSAHYMEGKTFEEMAEQFGFPSKNAARMKTSRCLALARELLEG